jgi:hypothetical protein
MITIMNNLFKVLNSLNLAVGTINSNIKDLNGTSGKNLMFKTPESMEELSELADRHEPGARMLMQFALQYGKMVAYQEALEELRRVHTFVKLMNDLNPEEQEMPKMSDCLKVDVSKLKNPDA